MARNSRKATAKPKSPKVSAAAPEASRSEKPKVTARSRSKATPKASAAQPRAGSAKGGAKLTPQINLTHDQIAARAYAIWQAKGCVPGQEHQNWQEAEHQLRGERVQA